jgi:serine protease Do
MKPFLKAKDIRIAGFALAFAAVGGLVGGAFGLVSAPSLRGPLLAIVDKIPSPGTQAGITVPPPVPTQTDGIAEDDQTVAVVERSLSSVVSIVISKDLSKIRQPVVMDPFGDSLAPSGPVPEGLQKIGAGSGFFVSADGLIVTNKHVVEDPEAEYTVVMRNGTKLTATVLARDPVLDLAVLKVTGANFPYLTFADSDKLKVGQTVIAIGNALDEFRDTVTKGIVSGLNRRLTADGAQSTVLIEEAIQTDAAINLGNSGGPLIDLRGRVVGVNTAMSDSAQLIGFALPSVLAKRDVEQVQKSGRITRPFLGVRYLIIDADLVAKNQLPVDHGVLIARGAEPTDLAIVPGSPADASGLLENDIILSVDGAAIDEEHSLSSLIGRFSPGDTVTLKILRHGTETDVPVVLGEFKPVTP